MRRRRGTRSRWFPILGFDTTGAGAVGLSTVDVRDLTVNADGTPNIIIVPIIPDIDVPVEQPQGIGGEVRTTLRDYVEGQSCIIDRIVGTIQVAYAQFTAAEGTPEAIVAAGIAVVPVGDDGQGNPAVSAFELDPLRADNSAQPWLWRRVWVLGNKSSELGATAVFTGYPENNALGDIRSGPHIDTKGTKRAIRREERIFLIYSTQPVHPNNSGEAISGTATACADLRVLGKMVRAKNRSAFK